MCPQHLQDSTWQPGHWELTLSHASQEGLVQPLSEGWPTQASDWASFNNKTYPEIEEHLTIVPSFILIFSFWLLAFLPEMRDSLGFMWMEGPDPPSCYLEKWPCCVGMSDLPHELFIASSRAESGVSCAWPEGVDGRMLLPTNSRRTRHTVHTPSSFPSALGSQLSAHSDNTKRYKDKPFL